MSASMIRKGALIPPDGFGVAGVTETGSWNVLGRGFDWNSPIYVQGRNFLGKLSTRLNGKTDSPRTNNDTNNCDVL